jgi:glutamate N-acetyltransferase/amino-acid N-acetyltransferase
MADLPKGFRAAGVAAGIKKNGNPDLALIVSDSDCKAAAVFTSNKVKAAPVIYDQRIMSTHADKLRAVVINAGCANACTGEQGLRNVEETAALVAAALSERARPESDGGADAAEAQPPKTFAMLEPAQVFVMSTGVIGVQLPMDRMRDGIPSVVAALSDDGLEDVARAIMTTDTRPKTASAELSVSAKGGTVSDKGSSVLVCGLAKGAGMIHPNMATLLSVVMTDAVIDLPTLQRATKRATDRSFNRISVDGDTSTNDTLLVLANGASGITVDENEFEIMLTSVCIDLAKQIVRDGEGATKLISIHVSGAKDERMAEHIGRTIARSPLVKTAFYGEDANWGRIVMAAGYSGEDVDPNKMSLWFGGVHVLANGAPTPYDEADATRAIQSRDVEVKLDLGLGDASATVWTCDLSHDYVTINGKYRT